MRLSTILGRRNFISRSHQIHLAKTLVKLKLTSYFASASLSLPAFVHQCRKTHVYLASSRFSNSDTSLRYKLTLPTRTRNYSNTRKFGIYYNQARTMSNSNIEEFAEADAAKFEEVFHQQVEEIISEDEANPDIADAVTRFRKMLEVTVPGGKRNRGLTVINAFRHLAKPEQLTDENVFKAMVLGWCVEWLQAYFLIADDIMDQSKTRRGQPCWYRQPDIGMDAINDSFYVECCIYKFIKKHMRGDPYYTDVVELFHETTYQTVVGQSLDLITSPESNRDLNRFTQQRYDAIVKWKTAFYSFYLPVALAMYMVGIPNEKAHRNAKTILLKMGHFFQVQDDYLDCYGDPKVIGKIGTDIEENKCGWLVVQALQRVNPQQRQIIEENYGIDDPSKVAKIKELYKELDLSSVYREYEEKSYQDLMALTEQHSGSLPQEMFVAYAKRIYKRKK